MTCYWTSLSADTSQHCSGCLPRLLGREVGGFQLRILTSRISGLRGEELCALDGTLLFISKFVLIAGRSAAVGFVRRRLLNEVVAGDCRLRRALFVILGELASSLLRILLHSFWILTLLILL